MQSQSSGNPKSAKPTKEEVAQGEELVEKIWDGIMEKGDDEIYEMNKRMSQLPNSAKLQPPIRRQGRKR